MAKEGGIESVSISSLESIRSLGFYVYRMEIKGYIL